MTIVLQVVYSLPNNSFQLHFFSFENVMSLSLCQKNNQDMNLTSHAWWETGKDSESTIYFQTKGHRINSLSQYLKLAEQKGLDIWKIVCVQNVLLNVILPFKRQRTLCPP